MDNVSLSDHSKCFAYIDVLLQVYQKMRGLSTRDQYSSYNFFSKTL